MAHLAQSMQMVSSQMGISWAMDRFSHRVVPTGKVPSRGRALTGSRSPLPASIMDVTRCTKSGASSGTGGRRKTTEVTASGTVTSCSSSRARSTAA